MSLDLFAMDRRPVGQAIFASWLATTSATNGRSLSHLSTARYREAGLSLVTISDGNGVSRYVSRIIQIFIIDQSFQKAYNKSMARTKEFDQDQALDAAMRLFWERGYEATSIQDLVEATGVQRQSLYDTFGSKHEMFLQSLMRYQALEGHQLSELTQKHPKGGLPLIRAIFESCASQTVCDARGCFVVNCAAELGSSDESVAERVQIGRDGMETVFKRCLEQESTTHKLKNSSSVSALAQFLVNAFFGLRLMAKTRPTQAMIDNVVSVTLAAVC